MAASLITLITAGMRMSIGPFFIPILNDFNMSRTDFSMIIAVGMLLYGVGMPIAGFMESRLGPKPVLLSGSFIVLGSCIWMVLSTSAIHLLFSFGIFLSIGLAFTSQISLTPVIVRWFVHRRGQALFYLSTGSMAGIAIMNPVSSLLINWLSWQHTMIIFGVGFFLLIIPIVLFVIREDVPEGADKHLMQTPRKESQNVHPAKEKQHVPHISLKASVQTLPFWQICLGLFACGFSMNLLGSHGVPMLIDHGFSNSISASAIGVIGLVAIPGTLILGSIADRIPRQRLLALIYITRGIGFICIVLVISVLQLYGVAMIAGLAWAGNVALSSAILSDLYGVRLVGILYGLAFFVHQMGATISTLLGGWAYETFDTHIIAFGGAGILLFIAGFASLKIPQYIKAFIQHKKRATV